MTESREIDIGHGHFIRYYCWAPDDLPENREQYGVPLPNIEKAGISVRHSTPSGEPCESAATFDLPQLREAMRGHVWQVQSWEPLTISPSLLCRACGDHGFIREGRWVPA